MTGPIGVGVIGASIRRGWASRTHLPALAALPDYRITAVATSRMETAREAAEHYGVPHAFDDGLALAREPSVDVVVVTVKVSEHLALVAAAIEAGKHVYCEWPLAVSTADARTLRDLAEKAGVRHAIGLQTRSSPTVNYLRDLVADGFVGRLLSVTVYSPTLSGGPTRDLARRHTADIANASGTMNINTGHVLDAIGYCLAEPVPLTSVVEVLYDRATVIETGEELVVTAPDQIVVGGRLAGGAVLSLHAHNGVRPNGVNFQARIFGTEGDLLLTSDGATGLQMENLTLAGSRGEEPFRVLTVPEKYFHVPPELRSHPVLNVAEALARFARSIRDGAPFDPDFSVAVGRHELIDTIYRERSELGV